MEAGRLEKVGDGRVSVPVSGVYDIATGDIRGPIAKIWTPGTP